MKIKKLLLAGSHAGATAVAVVEEINNQNLDWDLYWVGKKWATEDKKSYSLEFNQLPKLGVKFIEIESGKIENKFTRHTILAFLKIPFGIINSLFTLIKVKPNLILSFGGATGALISFWGWLLQIPVIIHEQTATVGRANKYSAFFAKKILLSRESSEKYFANNKTEVIGNPINIRIIEKANKTLRDGVKTILITGGSRGSVWINRAVKPVLTNLLKIYFVIHQTGQVDLSKFRNNKNSKYLCFSQVDSSEWIEILSKSDMVVSRAGANVCSEILALKKPSILIPIPWSYQNEQYENAKYLENLGLARILPQKELTPDRLEKEIKDLINNYSKILEKTKNLISPDIHASEKLVEILKNVNRERV